MWLRWVTSNISRQAARQKIVEATSKAFQAVTGGGGTDHSKGPPTQVALIFSLGIESGGLVDQLSNTVTTKCARFLEHAGQIAGRQVVIAESGVGAEAARQVTQDVIALHHPAIIIAAGFATSLHADVHRGDVVMANAVKNPAGSRLELSLNVSEESIEQTPSLHAGTLLSVDEMLLTPKGRHDAAEQSEAVVADMESFAVAEASAAAETRCLAIRLVTEGLDDRMPAEIEAMQQQQSTASRLGAMTGAMFRRLSSVKDMWKLKNDALRASDRLARFLTGVVEQLVPPAPDAASDTTGPSDSGQIENTDQPEPGDSSAYRSDGETSSDRAGE